VGSVEEDGSRPSYSQDLPVLTVSATSFGHYTSSLTETTSGSPIAGTLISAAFVSGVVALILSTFAFYSYPGPGFVQGGMAAEAQTFIKNLAYSRIPGGSPAIWNGINLRCGGDNPSAPSPQGSNQIVGDACPVVTSTTI
jgi:hypothetical protein